MTQVIEIEQQDGAGPFPGYVAEPAKAASAAIVVIQEAFGINAGIRRRCDMLAEMGYFAIAPDLYWRVAPGIELDPDIKPELDRGLELLNKFDQDQAVRDIQATISFARKRLPAGSKVGAVGYCIGGKLAYLTAARTDIDTTVGYYGYGIDQVLGEKNAIKNPFLLHLGKDDQFIDGKAQKTISDGFEDVPELTVRFYDGAAHGFATEFGERRFEQAAKLADERTAKFFEQNLK